MSAMARKIFLMRPVYPRAFRFQHELFPHAAGVFTKHEIRARRLHVPALARELAFQLARRPAGETRVETVAAARPGEQLLDVLRVHGDVDAFENVEGRCLGRAFRAKQRHQHLAHHRTAEVHRVAGLFMLARQRPVENHADRAAVQRLGDEHHAFAEVRVGEPRLRHQEHAIGGFRLWRSRNGQGKVRNKQNQRARHASVRKVIE
jgi:hypothetical protein